MMIWASRFDLTDVLSEAVKHCLSVSAEEISPTFRLITAQPPFPLACLVLDNSVSTPSAVLFVLVV